MADCPAAIVPAVALNVAVVALARTLTEAGRDRMLAMAPEIVTEAPLAGAALVSVMVQVEVALDASVVGVHCSVETRPGITRGMVAEEAAPFRVAVTVEF